MPSLIDFGFIINRIFHSNKRVEWISNVRNRKHASTGIILYAFEPIQGTEDFNKQIFPFEQDHPISKII